MPRRLVVLASIILSGVVAAVAQQAAQKPPARDPQRELATSVADGFTVAAVGDCIIARPVSQTPGFSPVGKTVRDADVAFGNFEGTALDLTRTPAIPQAEFGGVWIIGTPAVAKDLKSIGFDVMSRANNHATDWGLEGMRQTSRTLDEAGIVHAGVGEDRASARGARYFDTDKGRVDFSCLDVHAAFAIGTACGTGARPPWRPRAPDAAPRIRHARRAADASQAARRSAAGIRSRA